MLFSNIILYKSDAFRNDMSIAPAPVVLPLPSNSQFFMVIWNSLESSGVRSIRLGFMHIALPSIPKLAWKDQYSIVSCLNSVM